MYPIWRLQSTENTSGFSARSASLRARLWRELKKKSAPRTSVAHHSTRLIRPCRFAERPRERAMSVPSGSSRSSELPVGQNAGLRERIPVVFPDMQGRRGVHGQGVEAGRELVVVVESLVPGDDLARVAGHVAHDLDQACLGAPLRLVERPVLPDGIDQVIPLELVGISALAAGKPRPGRS